MTARITNDEAKSVLSRWVKPTKRHVLFLFAVIFFAGRLALAREAPPKLQIDVDFFDNLETVRPYCGSNWIDRSFAECQAHGVKRVTW